MIKWKGDKWTYNDELFLRKNYGILETIEIARKLDRTVKSIWNKASKLNLKCGCTLRHRKKISDALKNKPKKKFVIHSRGYILIFKPNHPFSPKSKYIRRSRLVIEEYLCENEPDHPALIKINGIKYMRQDWVAHHRNGIKNDDRIENMEAMPFNQHSKKHYPFKSMSSGKYILIKCPEHPFATKKGMIRRSRFVIEQHLRKNNLEHSLLISINGEKYLTRKCVVHHRNGIKNDDRIENIEAMTRNKHGELLLRRM